MKDLVTDANFECSPAALSLQAMDTSHVALVSMTLRSDGFAHYRCDRNISMGVPAASCNPLRCASACAVSACAC